MAGWTSWFTPLVAGVIFIVCHTRATASPVRCFVDNCIKCEPHKEFVCQTCVPGYESDGKYECREKPCGRMCMECGRDVAGHPQCYRCFVGFMARGRDCVIKYIASSAGDDETEAIISVISESMSHCGEHCLSCRYGQRRIARCVKCFPGFTAVANDCERDDAISLSREEADPGYHEDEEANVKDEAEVVPNWGTSKKGILWAWA